MEDDLLGTRELFQLAEQDPTFTGRYDLSSWSTVAEGSFAIVGRIHCTDLGRVVAVKIIRSKIPPEIREKVRAEVANAEAVQSPYVLHAYSPFFRGDLAWIEMPYVAGATLGDELARRRFAFDEATELGLNLLHALRAAHAVDVVHRDIKPANLMIPSDPPRRLLVLDFGISRAGDAARMTATGFPGTPQYASPEAWQGRPVGAAGDIYSATSVLYQLYTGQRPWPVNEDLSPEQLCQLHMRRLGPPRRVRDIDERLPRELDALLYSGLELDPAKRPSAAALYARIDAIHNGAGPAVATQPTPPTAPAAARPRSPAPRRRVAVVAVPGIIVLAIAAAWLFSRLTAHHPPQVPAQSVLSGVALQDGGGDALVIRNDTGRDVSTMRLDIVDALGQRHSLALDQLVAGQSARLERARWTPPLDQGLPRSIAARATVAGVVEEATLAVATPTPPPPPTTLPLPKGLVVAADDTRSIEITNNTGREIDSLRLTLIDGNGGMHEVEEPDLEPGMSTVIWPGKWSPPVSGALPKDVLVAATIGGDNHRGTLSIAIR